MEELHISKILKYLLYPDFSLTYDIGANRTKQLNKEEGHLPTLLIAIFMYLGYAIFKQT